MSRELKYRPDVDVLRAVAVIGVMAFHWNVGVFKGGFVGVDVFFVISGFLIASILQSSDLSPKTVADFLERRARRLLPAMMVVVVATCIAGWFLLVPPTMNELMASGLAGLSFTANLYFLGQAGYFDLPSAQKPLLHLWSLGVEGQFYLLAPLLVAIPLITRRWPAGLARVPIWVVALASAAYCFWATRYAPASAFYSTASRIWEFLIGMSLARGRLLIPARVAPYTTLLGYALIAVAMSRLREHSSFPGPSAALPCFGTALIIASSYSPPRDSWLRCGFERLREIGLRSFSIYLWHWPLFVFLPFMVNAQLSDPARIAALTIATLLLSFATYALVERRFRGTARSRSRVQFVGLVAGVVALVGCATALARVYPTYATANGEMFSGAYDLVRYDYRKVYRSDVCFLGPTDGFSTIDTAVCLHEGSVVAGSIMLWGDSMAAHYYPGLKAFISSDLILQANASACPPLVDVDVPDRPLCQGFNDDVLAFLTQNKSVRPLLAATWIEYERILGSDELLRALKRTIAILHERGIEPVLVGQSIQLTEPLPFALIRGANAASIVNAGIFGMDAKLREVARMSDVPFVSILESVCGLHRRCTLIEDQHPLIWDHMHLTEFGSQKVISWAAASISKALAEKASSHREARPSPPQD